MLNTQDAAHLESVRDQTLQALCVALDGVKDVALLDAPNQRNVGDSLILAGELAYFRRLGLRLRYIADLKGYSADDLRKSMPQGVVLLHGGGNFGDLWPGHQAHRELIAEQLSDYRVVQLPQSIYFASAERASRADDIIGKHPNFTALLRDHRSIERANEQLPHISTSFCPDMALGHTARQPRPRQSRRVLVIARNDLEKSSTLGDLRGQELAGREVEVRDWKTSGPHEAAWRFHRKALHLVRPGGKFRRLLKGPAGLRTSQALTLWSLPRLNDTNIRYAAHLYSSAELIIVDRLHAHILAGLMGIRHVALDNNYGKVSAIYDEYSGGLSTAHYASDAEQAVEIANLLLER